METKSILTIEIEGTIISEEAERLEDKLAEWLAKQGYTGKIEDSVTGNTTTFEFKPPKAAELLARRFNPQPKPEKRR
jgi:hypothetical protein